ncbi:SDR family oxidoreductase [Rhodococcus sp. BP-252]|uniref:SDR family NAD(P)-dependent oxidoreductase n=1 Tax=unclassified Rhodococcus (in: high G+C Gram-positive bacteria) TaxID=192944 RepID=UPI00143107BD|nr:MULTISPECIES: SDR family NAD(P)-dependent oxidoreductase [unclassified Rhodococcus (in: high G+C Gram-positive bacteria)]MBY6414077.1 SDR family oxidoreductase [Rhodococcus sp. BP-320]MBY6418848.1 SDR family oxidoreductase [Rhodococcus sp. BP-321]MBY6423407.1 SDR family oxidoreductase [Rhodococcus sp. BP-324]MBY6428861.1 SDR family oxidoreductase [Rhodococcus sp. BP-323]MBY6433867.1 SDR family oxidoreductase [Rhodococcus sp. BP-322]
MNFDGRSIVVTGAGSGMGRVESSMLAARGAKVWVTDIAVEPGLSVVDEIVSGGGQAEFFQLDVTEPASWTELASRIASADDDLHGLVNNAGVSHRFGIEDTTIEDWRRVMDINLSSVFYGMKACAPLLKRGDGGSIVNVSSIAGMVGYFAAGYGASKWGVRGLSKVGALEFAEHGVRVNSIHPGLVDTPLLHSGSSDFVDTSLKSVPAGRVADASEIAESVAFLLSDASRYITGTEMVVDGGLTSGGIYHRITSEL